MIIRILFILLLCVTNINARQKYVTDEPLMKIRFNKMKEVSYSNKLSHLVEKAIAINKDTKFILVSNVPYNSDSEDREFGEQKIAEIKKILFQHGLQEDSIEVRTLASSDVLNNEIHVFLAINRNKK